MIFIPHNVPSSKGSDIKSKYGVPKSKGVRKYLQKIGVKSYNPSTRIVEDYKTRPNLFKMSVGDYFDKLDTPQILGFHFVRKTRHKFDFHNAIQIVCDLLTAHRFISDDNMDCLIPVPCALDGEWHTYDKEQPGVYIVKFPSSIRYYLEMSDR